MKKTVFFASALASLVASACAGQLSDEDQIRLFNEHTGGSGGSGGTPTTTTTTTGSGGSGPAVDMCVVNTKALASCQQPGCHTPPLSAGLDLSAASVTTNAKMNFLDKGNAGSDMACMPGQGKLIDSMNAMNSLLYTKVQASGETIMPPCGAKMPVIGNFTMADKACILSWIQSVIMLK